jgi:hypothetical protein
MPVIAGFDKLASVPEEQITDKIAVPSECAARKR